MTDYSHDLKVSHFRKKKPKTMIFRNGEITYRPVSATAYRKIAQTSPRGCHLVPYVCRGYARFRNFRTSRPGPTFYLTVRALI